MPGKKITLAEAKASKFDVLVIYCEAKGCDHSAEMPLTDAVARWGETTRLDEVTLRCSQCGSRNIEVRPGHRHGTIGPGGLSKL